LTAVYRKVPEGFIAFVEELPGANAQSQTLEEARANLEEANSDRGELMAACGNHTPVVIAKHMNDSIQGYIRDTGISGDPIAINGKMISVREIKSRAQRGL